MRAIDADGVYTDHADVPIRRMVDKNQRCLRSYEGDAYQRLKMWVLERPLLLVPDAAQRGLRGLSSVDDQPHRARCAAFQSRWGFLRSDLREFITDVMYLALATDTSYYNDLPSFISFVASSQLEATVGHFCTRVFGKDEHASGAVVCTVMTLCLIEVVEEQAATKAPDPNGRRPDLDAMAKKLAKRAYEQLARDTSFAESIGDKAVETCVLPLMQFSEATRTTLCHALSHVCRHARGKSPAAGGDRSTDVSGLMSDFKAVAIAGVTQEQWQQLLDAWLEGEPKPLPWLQVALEAFSSQLRDVRMYADFWMTSAMLIEKENGRMEPMDEAKEVLTDEEASTLALKITSYPAKRHIRLQRAMELAITLYVLSRKENGGPMEYSNNPEDREIRRDVKKKVQSLKKAKGTTEDVGIMAGAYLMLKGKAQVYVSTAMEERWRDWIREMCVALGADADALAKDQSLSCGGLKKEEPSPEKWRSPLRNPHNYGMALHQVQKMLCIDQLPDNFERTPSYVAKFDLPLRDDDELTHALPGERPFDKLAHWVSKTSEKMPVNFRDSMRAFTEDQVVALLQLLLQTKSDEYTDLRSLLTYLDEEDHRKVQTWLTTHIFKKKATAAVLGRVLDMYRKFSAWVAEACKQVQDEETKTTAPRISELSRCGLNESRWDYEGEPVRSCAAAWFAEVRKLNPRPARIKGLKDWEGGHPFMRDDEAPYQLAPCWIESELSHKRTMNDQILMMELGGAAAWLQPQFHPMANWESYVVLLIRREMFQSKESFRTNSATAAYKADMQRISLCHSALNCNRPALFREQMGVFSEGVFKNEYPFDCAGEDRTLSARVRHMLVNTYKPSDAELEGPWGDWKNMDYDTLVADPLIREWAAVVNELTAKRDHVAVLVVDALAMRLRFSVGDIPLFAILYDPLFSKYPIDVRALKFTDHTAPISLRQYWEEHAGGNAIRQLQASVRKCCWGRPRLRLPGTAFCETVQHTTAMYMSWLKHANVSLPSLSVATTDDRKKEREALRIAIDTHHCKIWRMAEMVWGGCALIRYAQSRRHAYEVTIFDEPLITDFSTDPNCARLIWEAHFNLDQAELLLTVALETGSMETDGGMVTGASKDTSRARKFLREARELRSKWKQADAKRAQQRTLLIRQNAQKAEEKQRELENACQEVVSACVKGAIDNMLQAARAHDAAEAQRKADEERAEAARLAKEERRRKEERKEMLARVIQINRDVAERRAAHLAARAVIEKKAAEREKREAAEKAKQLRIKQWEAERARHKAEEEERMARFQQEAEAERRERERRRAEEAARLAAEARIAEAAAAAERVREAEAQRAAKEAQRVEDARIRISGDAVRAGRNVCDALMQAMQRGEIPHDEDVARRWEQSQADRNGSRKCDRDAFNAKIRALYRRQTLTRAYARWRSVIDMIEKVQATLKAGTSGARKPSGKTRSRNGLEDFTYQRRRVLRANAIVEHWEAEGTPEAERSEANVERDMLARAATAYIRSKAGDRHAVGEDLIRKIHYWQNKRGMARCFAQWRAGAADQQRAARQAAERAAAKALEDEEAKAEARRATQERCNAIMRKKAESMKQKEAEAYAKHKQDKYGAPSDPTPTFDRAVGRKSPPSRESPPPLPPSPESLPPLLSPASPPPELPPPPVAPSEPAASVASVASARPPELTEEPVTSHAQWRRDYHRELARVQCDSQMQWDTGTGWAVGAHTAWLAYGGQAFVNARVRERQQWDMQCATFRANATHMERVRKRQREAVDEANRRELKEAAEKYIAELEDKKAEHGIAMHAQMEAWKRTLQAEEHKYEAKQHAAEADFQAKLETISGQNASLDAFEAENHTLLRERANLFCGRLRARLRAHEPNAATSRLAPKHECVVCLDATCTHLATTCGHVIGCGACCASLTACPICCATTTFVEMRFPH
jgi:hypothetical protein